MMSHLPVLLLKSNADTVFPQRSEAIFNTRFDLFICILDILIYFCHLSFQACFEKCSHPDCTKVYRRNRCKNGKNSTYESKLIFHGIMKSCNFFWIVMRLQPVLLLKNQCWHCFPQRSETLKTLNIFTKI